MKIISPNEYLDALATLHNRTAARRFIQIGKEFPKLSALESDINSLIKQEIGFGINEIINSEQIDRFEKKIDHEFSKITSQRLIKYPVDDEIDLIRIAKESTVEYLKNFDINIAKHFNGYLKDYKLSAPYIKTIVRTSSQVTIIPDDKDSLNNNFLVVSPLKYLNKSCNAFIHLSHIESKKNVLSVVSIIVLNSEITHAFNPVRYFLNILNWYGVELKVNNKIKKFFIKEDVLIKTMDGNMKIFEVENLNLVKDKVFVTAQVVPKTLHSEVKFAYGLNMSKYFTDLFKREI